MKRKIISKIICWCCLLCFVITLPCAAYSLLGFFVPSIYTCVPYSGFSSTQISNMSSCVNKWNSAAGETIFEVSNSTHSKTNYYSRDGKNYIYMVNRGTEHLGECYHPSSNGALIEFDINMNPYFAWSGTSSYDFYSIFLHEVGHAAGLDHSTNPNAVMYATFSAGETRRTLNFDDNAGMQDIYYWNW